MAGIEHELVYLSYKRASCKCGWERALKPDEVKALVEADASVNESKDLLMDRYNKHRKEGG